MGISISDQEIEKNLYSKDLDLNATQKFTLLNIIDREGYGLTIEQGLTLISFTSSMNPEFLTMELEHILITVINTFFYQ